MKKDKYPLAGGLISGDNSVPRGPNSAGQTNSNSAAVAAAAASVAARDMYGSMNGYMPNGYDYNMYSQSPYGYGRYDSMSAAAMYSSAAAAYNMNGSYMSSMYPSGGPVPPTSQSGGNGGSSPYGSMQSMSPVGHASHSPGSVKSENGGGQAVSMPQDSPSMGYNVKREMTPPPNAGPPGNPASNPPSSVSNSSNNPPNGPPTQDLNRMISMYLPGGGDAATAAAAAAAASADPRLHSMYAGHYQAMVQGHSLGGSATGVPPSGGAGSPLPGPPPPTDHHLTGPPSGPPPPPAPPLAHM